MRKIKKGWGAGRSGKEKKKGKKSKGSKMKKIYAGCQFFDNSR
jgi:hypothetical protein